jgi:hypothetical protein
LTSSSSRSDKPFATSLCHRCEWLRLVEAARSTFLKCGEPALEKIQKYPRQPVATCVGFRALSSQSR